MTEVEGSRPSSGRKRGGAVGKSAYPITEIAIAAKTALRTKPKLPR